MEKPTLNLVLAVVGANLADAGHLDQSERIMYLVGHPDVNGRSVADANDASAHSLAILGAFGEMSEACADALAEWAQHWAALPAARANLTAGLES